MSSGADRCARKDCQGLRMAHGHGFHDFVEPAPQSETREEWQARRDQREVDARLGMLRASALCSDPACVYQDGNGHPVGPHGHPVEPAPQSCPARSGSGEPTDICARPKCLSPRSYNIHDPDRGGHVFVEDAARLVGLVIHQSDPDAAVGSYHGINSSAAILGTFDNCNDAKIFSLGEGNAIHSKALAAGRALGRDDVMNEITKERDQWAGVNAIAYNMLDVLRRTIIARRGKEGT